MIIKDYGYSQKRPPLFWKKKARQFGQIAGLNLKKKGGALLYSWVQLHLSQHACLFCITPSRSYIKARLYSIYISVLGETNLPASLWTSHLLTREINQGGKCNNNKKRSQKKDNKWWCNTTGLPAYNARSAIQRLRPDELYNDWPLIPFTLRLRRTNDPLH